MKIEISQNQARQIAFGIYKDIPQYIKDHPKEYQEFLKAERQEGNIE